jgi:predicted Rossmann-fold nucleotide-binding protein
MVFANVGGFWDPMMELLRHMTDKGFVHTAHRVQPLVIDDVSEIVPAIMGRAADLASADRDGEEAVISKM